MSLSPQQRKWFQTVRETLERETGRSLEDWAALVRETCPVEGHKARLAWLKQTYGLGVNRGSGVLALAFPDPRGGWDDQDALIAALWTDPAQFATFEAIRAVAMQLPDTTLTARRGYTAFARRRQFAAAQPKKDGAVRLGLAIAQETHPTLAAPKKSEAWSQRLTAVVALRCLEAVAEAAPLIAAAHARS